jgi:hypothetical protein
MSMTAAQEQAVFGDWWREVSLLQRTLCRQRGPARRYRASQASGCHV